MAIVDLDELVLRCRDERARLHIQEAVACYRAGAYRSCIVATWNAVVFDFLHKLRELELSGDKNALSKLKAFEAIRAGGESKLKEALEFERTVLDAAASEFELLTPLEKEDLARLQFDRNRCAHPSMQAEDVPYVPSAELARTHIRSAVELLLERQPVQGMAAFSRICDDIKSEYFPLDKVDAVKHFNEGPLARARSSLIRNLLVGITKSNLTGDISSSEKRRQRVALAAIVEMYKDVSEKILVDELPKIAQSVDDGNLIWVIAYCKYIPDAWEFMGLSMQGKLTRYLENQTDDALLLALVAADGVQGLKSIAMEKAQTLSRDRFSKLVSRLPIKEYIPFACDHLKKSGSFRGAEDIFENIVMPLCPRFAAEDINPILEIILENDQIWNASGIQLLILQFFNATILHFQNTKDQWKGFIEKIDTLQRSEDKDWWYNDLKARIKEASGD